MGRKRVKEVERETEGERRIFEVIAHGSRV
jgi:hypothetical protein